jgi:hypothetical protein
MKWLSMIHIRWPVKNPSADALWKKLSRFQEVRHLERGIATVIQRSVFGSISVFPRIALLSNSLLCNSSVFRKPIHSEGDYAEYLRPKRPASLPRGIIEYSAL